MEKRICKTPELMKARNALIKFLDVNHLNPAKDYSKHPVYGKEYRELLLTLNIERDKVLVRYPQTDIKNFKKYHKMKTKKKAAKAAAVEPAKVEKKAKKASKNKVEKAEKKTATCTVSKYDYPLIDGREMTSLEKKKYRAEQRKLAKGEDAPKAKKEEKVKKTKAKAAVEEEPKKAKKAPKLGKNKKKAKKEED